MLSDERKPSEKEIFRRWVINGLRKHIKNLGDGRYHGNLNGWQVYVGWNQVQLLKVVDGEEINRIFKFDIEVDRQKLKESLH